MPEHKIQGKVHHINRNGNVPKRDASTLSLEQLHILIEHLPHTVLVTNGQGTIMLLNSAYEKRSGVKKEYMIGRNIGEFTGKLYAKSASLLAIEHRKVIMLEQKLFNNDWLTYVIAEPIFDQKGNIIMVISSNHDYMEIERLRIMLDNSQELINKYQSEIEAVKSQLVVHSKIVAIDKKTLAVLYKLNKSARFDSTVLITGETGTGKEEFAKYIHTVSNRHDKPFVRVNCGAISETLMESELFGYEKGAFTGASQSGKRGLFEVADTGSIFLDEIGELPLDMQVKLLRVLQEKEVTRIGGTSPISIDVRVIAATNSDLEKKVVNRQFREDLYYRLNVIKVEIPPLRQRRDDIIPLAQYFLSMFNKRYCINKTLCNAVYHILLNYDWPGNVRELKNVIEQAIIMSEGDKIGKGDLPLSSNFNCAGGGDQQTIYLEEMLKRLEFYHINEAYNKYGNVRDAAAYLNMKPSTYVRKRNNYRQKFE